jgi:hypothetical protein
MPCHLTPKITSSTSLSVCLFQNADDCFQIIYVSCISTSCMASRRGMVLMPSFLFLVVVKLVQVPFMCPPGVAAIRSQMVLCKYTRSVTYCFRSRRSRSQSEVPRRTAAEPQPESEEPEGAGAKARSAPEDRGSSRRKPKRPGRPRKEASPDPRSQNPSHSRLIRSWSSRA